MIFNVEIMKISNMGTPRIPSPKRSNLAHLSHCPTIFFSKVATLTDIRQLLTLIKDENFIMMINKTIPATDFPHRNWFIRKKTSSILQ